MNIILGVDDYKLANGWSEIDANRQFYLVSIFREGQKILYRGVTVKMPSNDPWSFNYVWSDKGNKKTMCLWLKWLSVDQSHRGFKNDKLQSKP